MAKKFNATMFDKIKDQLKKKDRVGSSAFTNVMKFPAGHTYTVRLIPNVDNIDETFFHHYVNQWSSKKDGSFISAISLKSFGERDPIAEERWKLYKDWKDSGPDKDEKFENPIKEKEQWFVNILVVDDPSNPENNGKVKILNMGPQLKGIVDDAITGEGADEFGVAIFDLSKDGCDFKINAAEQGVFTTYIKSRFSGKSSINLSDDEIDKVYEQVHDLKQVHSVRTYEELQDLLADHFHCEEVAPKKEERKQLPSAKESKAKPAKETKKEKEPVEDDEIPMFNGDADVDDLLAELDID